MYALSYDEVDALADYARVHNVTFPLLSDPDNQIIERFGILNTLIDPDDHPWYGVPYPGTYIIGADGIITAKYFESSLQLRPSTDQLLRSALGERIQLAPMADVTEAPESVEFDIHFDGDRLPAGVIHDLIVRFTVPKGQHLYGDPVPEGMVATSVEVEPDLGLVVKPTIFPPTTAHTLAGSGETLHVFGGEVLVRIPLTHQSRSLIEVEDGSHVQRVVGTVRWQSCDDETCHLPRTEGFSIDIPAVRHDRSEHEFENPDGMDISTHLQKMISRRSNKTLSQVLTEMTGKSDS